MRLAVLQGVVFALVSCGERVSKETPAPSDGEAPIEWLVGTKPLDAYRDQDPDRRILAFFNMDGFDTIGMHFERQLNQNRHALFAEGDVLFLKYDCVHQGNQGLRELEKLGIGYLPVFVAHAEGAWEWTSNHSGGSHYQSLSEMGHRLVAEVREMTR